MAVAGYELRATRLHNCEGAESVVFQLKQPIGIVEWVSTTLKRHCLELEH